MKIHVKDSKDLIIPQAATPQSSGYDVVALEDPKIVGEQDGINIWKSIDYIEYKTGLFIAPQADHYYHDYHTLIFPRSSVRKYNLVLANSIGLIDNDYRGELILCFKYIWQPDDMFPCVVPLDDTTGRKTLRGQINMEKIYKKGDKIGQLVSEVTNHVDWIVVADLTTTVRGTGGFGSTTSTITEKKSESPKENSNIVEKWKKTGASESPTPPKYETMVREREKRIS
jgi:dUTP pyrophosphatase